MVWVVGMQAAVVVSLEVAVVDVFEVLGEP